MAAMGGVGGGVVSRLGLPWFEAEWQKYSKIIRYKIESTNGA